MKTMSWILIFAMFLYSGCSSTRFIDFKQSAYDELNKKLKGKKGIITLTDGVKLKGENIRVAPDSTSLIESKSKRKQTVPTTDVREINIKRAHGTLVGLGVGLLCGFLLGSIVKSEEEPERRTEKGFPRKLISVKPNWGGSFAFTGSVIFGILIGSGSTKKYVFSEPMVLPSKSTKEDEVTIISDRVGEVIDLDERNKYNLFPADEGSVFISAVCLKLPDGSYVIDITYLDEKKGEEKILRTRQTESQILKIREHIEKFE